MRVFPWPGETRILPKTRPSRPIRCDVWIVKRMRYPTDKPTDQQTDRPTDTASYGCFVAPKNFTAASIFNAPKLQSNDNILR